MYKENIECTHNIKLITFLKIYYNLGIYNMGETKDTQGSQTKNNNILFSSCIIHRKEMN